MIRIGASEEVWDAISMLLTEFVLENHWQISGNADNARESIIELIGVLGKAQMIKTSLGIEGTAGIQIEASKKEWEASKTCSRSPCRGALGTKNRPIWMNRWRSSWQISGTPPRNVLGTRATRMT